MLNKAPKIADGTFARSALILALESLIKINGNQMVSKQIDDLYMLVPLLGA